MASKIGPPLTKKIGEFSSKLIRSPVDFLSHIRPGANPGRISNAVDEQSTLDACALEIPPFQESVYQLALKCVNYPMNPTRMQQFRDDLAVDDYKILRDVFGATLAQHKTILTTLNYSEKQLQTEFRNLLRSLASNEHPYYKKSSFSSGYDEWSLEFQRKLSQYHKANHASNSGNDQPKKSKSPSWGFDLYKHFLKSILVFSIKKYNKVKPMIPPLLENLLVEYEIRFGIDSPHRTLNILSILYEDYSMRLQRVGIESAAVGLAVPPKLFTRFLLVVEAFGTDVVPSNELSARADVLFSLTDSLSKMISRYTHAFPMISVQAETHLKAALGLWRKIELSKTISDVVYELGTSELNAADLKSVKGLSKFSTMVQQRIFEGKKFYGPIFIEFDRSFDLLQVLTDIYFPPMLQAVSQILEYGEFNHELFNLYFVLHEIDGLTGDFCPNSPILPLRDLLQDWVICPYEKTKLWVTYALQKDKLQPIDAPQHLHSESVQEVFASCFGALELMKLFELGEADRISFWQAIMSSLEYYAQACLRLFQRLAKTYSDLSSAGRRDTRTLSLSSSLSSGANTSDTKQDCISRMCAVISNMDASLSQLSLFKVVNNQTPGQENQKKTVPVSLVESLEIKIKGIFLETRTSMVDLFLEKSNAELFQLLGNILHANAETKSSPIIQIEELIISNLRTFEDLTYVPGEFVVQRYWNLIMHFVERMTDPASSGHSMIRTPEEAEAMIKGLKILQEFIVKNQGLETSPVNEESKKIFDMLSFYDASTALLIFEFEKQPTGTKEESTYRKNAIMNALYHRMGSDKDAEEFIRKQRKFIDSVNHLTFGIPITEPLLHVYKVTYQPVSKGTVLPSMKFGTTYIFEKHIAFYSGGIFRTTIIVIPREKIQRIRRVEKHGVEIHLFEEAEVKHAFFVRDNPRDEFHSHLVTCWMPNERDPDSVIFNMEEQQIAEKAKTRFQLKNLEKVIDRFACTSNLISAGYLIITSNHICFDPALGNTTISIPFQNVVIIQKELLRSIKVTYTSEAGESHFSVGGFFSVDSAYASLMSRWERIKAAAT